MQFILSLAKLTRETVTEYIACEYTKEEKVPWVTGEDRWVELRYVELCPSFMMCVEDEIPAQDDARAYTRRVCPQSFGKELVVKNANPEARSTFPSDCREDGEYVYLEPQAGAHYVKYDNSK